MVLEQFEGTGVVTDSGFQLDDLEYFRRTMRQFNRGSAVF